MNNHLKLVREFHDAYSIPQAAQGGNMRLSEMDIISHQAMLMEGGSELFRAIKAGDMVDILAGMINLAYCALAAIAMEGGDVLMQPVSWRHDGSVISLMRLFSDKINHCASGNPDNYSDVYCLCVYLSKSFINADFDRAFQIVHDNRMSSLGEKDKLTYENVNDIMKLKCFKNPDLSDCLYE